MSTRNLKSELEALLFVSDEPASTEVLAAIVEVDPAEVRSHLEALQKEYEQAERGFLVRQVAGGWRLLSNPAYHEPIERFVLSWDTRKLSQAALEALAVIAYRQPVTRGAVNAIRGVNSEAVMGSLLEKGLIREVGRQKSLGSAILYGTSNTFLEKFGLADLDQLPPFEQFAPQESVQDAIRERLDATLPVNDELSVEREFDVVDNEIEIETDG
jgi:segregation and condensation protein B